MLLRSQRAFKEFLPALLTPTAAPDPETLSNRAMPHGVHFTQLLSPLLRHHHLERGVAAIAALPTISIVGGGLGGLTLARILQQAQIPCTVYENDASAAARGQGGMFDLHEQSGQAAMRAAGLQEGSEGLVLKGRDDTRIVDTSGNVLLEAPGTGARPEVRAPRYKLCSPRCVHVVGF